MVSHHLGAFLFWAACSPGYGLVIPLSQAYLALAWRIVWPLSSDIASSWLVPSNCRAIETTAAQALLAFAQLLTEELMQEIAAASSFLAVLLDRYSIYDSRRVATLHDVPDHHADVALTVLADMGLRWLAPPAIQQDVGGLHAHGGWVL